MMETRDQQIERLWNEIVAEMEKSPEQWTLCVEEYLDVVNDQMVKSTKINGRWIPEKLEDGHQDQFAVGLLIANINFACLQKQFVQNRKIDQPVCKHLLYRLASTS